MTYSLDVRLSAELDLHEATVWYKTLHCGLESDLVLCVEEAMARAVRQPLSYQHVYKHVRKVEVKRFPYHVYFFVDGKRVVVFAVAHEKRHPRSWKKRV